MAFPHKRIFLIPLDSRPVCYDMPRRLAEMAGLELHMPSPALLGRLKKPANFKTFSRWVKNHLFENAPLIVALDTVAYGGLIPSRLNEEGLDVLEDRLNAFFKQIKTDGCYGFSSILRIADNDATDEEPDYWAPYGRKLYRYSVEHHRTGNSDAGDIPPAVLNDFLARREKNFTLNERYLKRLEAHQLDYLTFCQDDTGAFGLNVQEAERLDSAIATRDLRDRAHIQTGADEVAACMLTRWMASSRTEPLKVYPFYSSDAGRRLIARFDGLPIEAVVEKAVKACGAILTTKAKEADLWLMTHTPEDRQGDHCSRERANVNPEQIHDTLDLIGKALASGKPVSVADVAFANGGDPRLMEKLISRFEDLTGLYGYAGWNTPGNAIGTAISMGLIRFMAEEQKSFRPQAFCKLLLIRLADDWLYQADVRGVIRRQGNGGPPDEKLLNLLMADGLSLLKKRLGLEKEAIHCRFPCQRTFEVEVVVR